MESAGRNRKRKPFSNLTNLPSTKPSLSVSTSIGSNTPNPSFPTQSLSNTVHADRTASKTAIVRSPRQNSEVEAKLKEKEVVPFSCPPAGRTKAIGDEVQNDQRNRHKVRKIQRDICLSKSSLSSSEVEEQSPIISEEDAMFINNQIAYFSEIDAFELVEEVASEAELE